MEIIKSYSELICPASGKTEKVYYRHITETEFVEIYGCDNCNGSATCQKCMALIREELTPK